MLQRTKRVLLWPVSFVRLASRGEWREIIYKARVIAQHLDFAASEPELRAARTHPGAKPYYPSGGPELESILRDAGIRREDSILDLGAGKGAALITMAKFPFSRLAGVEISADLAGIALNNFSRLGLKNIEMYCEDAASFAAYERFTYIYIFNPFFASIMEPVIERIAGAVNRSKRPMRIIYKAPTCHDLLVRAGCRVIRRYDCGSELPTTVYEMSPRI